MPHSGRSCPRVASLRGKYLSSGGVGGCWGGEGGGYCNSLWGEGYMCVLWVIQVCVKMTGRGGLCQDEGKRGRSLNSSGWCLSAFLEYVTAGQCSRLLVSTWRWWVGWQAGHDLPPLPRPLTVLTSHAAPLPPHPQFHHTGSLPTGCSTSPHLLSVTCGPWGVVLTGGAASSQQT